MAGVPNAHLQTHLLKQLKLTLQEVLAIIRFCKMADSGCTLDAITQMMAIKLLITYKLFPITDTNPQREPTTPTRRVIDRGSRWTTELSRQKATTLTFSNIVFF